MPLKFVKSQKGKQLLINVIKRVVINLFGVVSIIKNINAAHALRQQWVKLVCVTFYFNNILCI
jgi:hypothetical protein